MVRARDREETILFRLALAVGIGAVLVMGSMLTLFILAATGHA